MLCERVIFCLFLTFQHYLGRTYLTLSSNDVIWENQTRCKPKESQWICRNVDGVTYKDCRTDYMSDVDISRLPKSFKAWIGAYVEEAVTITYKGCYKKPDNLFHYYAYNDHTSCGRNCRKDRYEYFGVWNGTCWCIPSYLLISQPDVVEKPEHSCLTNNMTVYKIINHPKLEIDFCPIVYILSSIVSIALDKCDEGQTFYCYKHEHGDNGTKSLPWSEAAKNCSAISSRLARLWEVPRKEKMKYWLDGTTYYNYEMDTRLPLYKTRCAALVAENEKYTIQHVDCSSQLPYIICHTPTEEAGKIDTGLPILLTTTKTQTTSSVASTFTPGSSVVTSILFTEPTTDATILTTNSTLSTPKPDIPGVVAIVLPSAVLLGIIAGLLVFFLKRKHRHASYDNTIPSQECTRILHSEPSTPIRCHDGSESHDKCSAKEVAL